MSVLGFIVDQWNEGARHGFPRCCRARWILDRARPSLTEHVLPGGLAGRLRGLRPRYAVADGMVPCEYHLAMYLLTGDRSGWRNPLPARMCCGTRKDLTESGAATLTLVTFEPETLDGVCGETVSVWMFGEGDGGSISVTHCPWCGSVLP